MSGRSGYRKTGRKRDRNAVPVPKSDYVLRFQLPPSLAFAIAPGQHGWGVTVGFNDLVFVTGRSPQHCVSLTLDFLERIGARESPQIIAASVVKLLPCPAYRPTVVLREGFKPLSNNLEAIHDNISRNATRSRPCTIVVASESITVAGATPRPITGPRAA